MNYKIAPSPHPKNPTIFSLFPFYCLSLSLTAKTSQPVQKLNLSLSLFPQNMAATASWQPQEEGFNSICALLQHQISPSSDKSQIWQQLQHFSHFPDFNNYLVFILARAEVCSSDIWSFEGVSLIWGFWGSWVG